MNNEQAHLQAKIVTTVSFFPAVILIVADPSWFEFLIAGCLLSALMAVYLARSRLRFSNSMSAMLSLPVVLYYSLGSAILFHFGAAVPSYAALYIGIGMVGGYWYFVVSLKNVVKSDISTENLP